jgi:hypothetical protein
MKNMRSNQWEEIEKRRVRRKREDNKPKRPIGSDYRKMRDDFDED